MRPVTTVVLLMSVFPSTCSMRNRCVLHQRMTNDGLQRDDLRNPGGHVQLRGRSARPVDAAAAVSGESSRLSIIPEAVWSEGTETRLIKRDPPVRTSLSASACSPAHGRGNSFQLRAALIRDAPTTGDL